VPLDIELLARFRRQLELATAQRPFIFDHLRIAVAAADANDAVLTQRRFAPQQSE
jgi:hypothetical protein